MERMFDILVVARSITRPSDRRTLMSARMRRTGYSTITPYLMTPNVPGLVEFITQTFQVPAPELEEGAADGMMVDLVVGDSLLIIGTPWMGDARPVALYVYVDDVDAVYQQALEAGAQPREEPTDQRYGDRRATVIDPYGNLWCLATYLGED
jgi:PhnB protein